MQGKCQKLFFPLHALEILDSSSLTSMIDAIGINVKVQTNGFLEYIVLLYYIIFDDSLQSPFGSLPQNFRRWRAPMNAILSFCNCKLSGGDTLRHWGHSNPTYCNKKYWTYAPTSGGEAITSSLRPRARATWWHFDHFFLVIFFLTFCCCVFQYWTYSRTYLCYHYIF